jgi:hypothetical protein
MGAASCPAAGCGTPTAGPLCVRCGAGLSAALRALCGPTGLLAELDITRAGQGVLSDRRRHINGAHLLLYNPAAAHLADAAATVLTTWARAIHDDHPQHDAPRGSTVDAAAWLADLPPGLLAAHVAAGELHADLTGLVERISRCIDRPPDRLYGGPCGAQCDDGPCPGHLYARAGEDVARCPYCHTSHAIAERRAWMLNHAADHTVTAAVALGWTRLLLGRVIPDATWRSWVLRRRIVPHGRDRFGRSTYRFGDVHDLVSSYVARRRPGP